MHAAKKMFARTPLMAAVVGIVATGLPATAQAALAGFAWARVSANQVNYNFIISPVWAYRVQLQDVTGGVPGPWMVILGPVGTGGAGAAVAANFAGLLPGHVYRLRVQSRANAGGPWVNEGMSGVF